MQPSAGVTGATPPSATLRICEVAWFRSSTEDKAMRAVKLAAVGFRATRYNFSPYLKA